MNKISTQTKHTCRKTRTIPCSYLTKIFYISIKNNLFFFKFIKDSGTQDQNLGPKYLKQFRPSLVQCLKIIIFFYFENLVLCELTELASLNILYSTSNPVIVLHINLQICNLFTFNFSTPVFF